MTITLESILSNAKPPEESKYPPYIQKEGSHLLALAKYKLVTNSSKPPFIAAEFVVLESPAYPKGYLVQTIWKPYHPERWRAEKEATRASVFVMSLFDKPTPKDAGKASVELSSSEDAGRGLAIRAIVFKKPKRSVIEWEHVPGQTDETIKTRRALCESTLAQFEEKGQPSLEVPF